VKAAELSGFAEQLRKVSIVGNALHVWRSSQLPGANIQVAASDGRHEGRVVMGLLKQQEVCNERSGRGSARLMGNG
jgi:hypothetical protein